MYSGNKVVISWIVSIGFVGMPEFMSSKTFALCRQRSFLHGPAGIRSDEEKENNFFGRVSFMDAALLLEYGWVLLVLIGLEGILAADNALVMAVMVKHLPEEKRKKALFYGLAGAFVLRFWLFIRHFIFGQRMAGSSDWRDLFAVYLSKPLIEKICI